VPHSVDEVECRGRRSVGGGGWAGAAAVGAGARGSRAAAGAVQSQAAAAQDGDAAAARGHAARGPPQGPPAHAHTHRLNGVGSAGGRGRGRLRAGRRPPLQLRRLAPPERRRHRRGPPRLVLLAPHRLRTAPRRLIGNNPFIIINFRSKIAVIKSAEKNMLKIIDFLNILHFDLFCYINKLKLLN